EKGEGVADEAEPIAADALRVVRIFAGDANRLALRPDSDMIADPRACLDLAVIDGVRIARIAIEITRLADDADADDVGVHRDVPEPALLRHVGDGRRALVEAGIALGALVVAPDRNLVQIGVAILPAELSREQRVAAAGVD